METFVSTSLVCKAWTKPSQIVLFRWISLTDTKRIKNLVKALERLVHSHETSKDGDTTDSTNDFSITSSDLVQGIGIDLADNRGVPRVKTKLSPGPIIKRLIELVGLKLKFLELKLPYEGEGKVEQCKSLIGTKYPRS